MKSLTNAEDLDLHDYQHSQAITFSMPVLREPLIKI
ncbi:hypothetical protein J2T02_000323 [Chitinophaga terrae (ex Kim and Jung 2007)]|jgi:hypothetical protein|nr:hypothetical protein [Chitinophaga terrae (ex Kim and Jung 2007)]